MIEKRLSTDAGRKEKEEEDRTTLISTPLVLESKNYNFLVPGTMPVLEFDITSQRNAKQNEIVSGKGSQHLRLEIYNPLAGEVFEAKFPKGRIEVDNDGSITYFTTSTDSVNLSVFLGRNLILTIRKDGSVSIRTPSRIVSLQQDLRSSRYAGKGAEEENAQYDYINFKLE